MNKVLRACFDVWVLEGAWLLTGWVSLGQVKVLNDLDLGLKLDASSLPEAG